ncbi:hypothetical protein K2Q08_00320 [Patescibacteria group bacterium]|nr:hypothetical protein [Patescibacteria group bacterium]
METFRFPAAPKIRQWMKGLGIEKGQKVSYLAVGGDVHGDCWPEPYDGRYYRGVRRNGSVLFSRTPTSRPYEETSNAIVRIDSTGEPIKLLPEEPDFYRESHPATWPYSFGRSEEGRKSQEMMIRTYG